MNISLAMIVKNEKVNIKRCISSVQNLVDEIVVVDTGSTDGTIDILRQFNNVKLYNFNWCDDFSAARNFALDKTNGDYILVLDADEYVIKGTRRELETAISKNMIGRVLIESNFSKKNEELYSSAYVSRFFPKSLRYIGAIHEQLDSNKGRIKLDFIVKHDGYNNENKGQRNIPLLQKELLKNPNDAYYLFQLGKEFRISNLYSEAYLYLRKSYNLVKSNVPYFGELVIELIYASKECNKDILDIISSNETKLGKVSDFHFAKGLYYLNYCLTHPNEIGRYLNKIEESFMSATSLNTTNHIEYVLGTSSYLADYNLGVYYEVIGNLNKAVEYYKKSSQQGYDLAEKRLRKLIQ